MATVYWHNDRIRRRDCAWSPADPVFRLSGKEPKILNNGFNSYHYATPVVFDAPDNVYLEPFDGPIRVAFGDSERLCGFSRVLRQSVAGGGLEYLKGTFSLYPY